MEVRCPYCGEQAILTDSSEVYHGKSYGMIWICRPCKAWVGTHKNSKRHVPLGRLANAELRRWKIKAHDAFDDLWNRKMNRDRCSKTEARTAGYSWLAAELGIKEDDCHIGMFDVPMCRKAVDVCVRIRTKEG